MNKIYPSPIKQIVFTRTSQIRNPFREITSINCDGFSAIENTKSKNEDLFNTFLNKKGKVSFEEYKRIKWNHPELIQKAYDFIEPSK